MFLPCVIQGFVHFECSKRLGLGRSTTWKSRLYVARWLSFLPTFYTCHFPTLLPPKHQTKVYESSSCQPYLFPLPTHFPWKHRHRFATMRYSHHSQSPKVRRTIRIPFLEYTSLFFLVVTELALSVAFARAKGLLGRVTLPKCVTCEG